MQLDRGCRRGPRRRISSFRDPGDRPGVRLHAPGTRRRVPTYRSQDSRIRRPPRISSTGHRVDTAAPCDRCQPSTRLSSTDVPHQPRQYPEPQPKTRPWLRRPARTGRQRSPFYAAAWMAIQNEEEVCRISANLFSIFLAYLITRRGSTVSLVPFPKQLAATIGRRNE